MLELRRAAHAARGAVQVWFQRGVALRRDVVSTKSQPTFPASQAVQSDREQDLCRAGKGALVVKKPLL